MSQHRGGGGRTLGHHTHLHYSALQQEKELEGVYNGLKLPLLLYVLYLNGQHTTLVSLADTVTTTFIYLLYSTSTKVHLIHMSHQYTFIPYHTLSHLHTQHTCTHPHPSFSPTALPACDSVSLYILLSSFWELMNHTSTSAGLYESGRHGYDVPPQIQTVQDQYHAGAEEGG